MKPLSENPAHLRYLCYRLDIGPPRREVCRVPGGLHHRMWRLETDRGVYAVKQLSPDTDLNDPDTISHYNATEAIGEIFSRHGIGAIFALKRGAHYLQLIDGAGYLLYPWSNAVPLRKDCISEKHALEIARLLARMHGADISAPEPRQAQGPIHQAEDVIALVNQAHASHTPEARTLKKHLPEFLAMLDCHKEAMTALQKRTVISHGNLDQQNVLWDATGKPLVIDWESARKLNPTYEILLEALDWSGIASRFAPGVFESMLSTYVRARGEIDADSLEASFRCILGEWLSWLMYNVGRTVHLGDTEQHVVGLEQVHSTLATISRLEQLMPRLLSSARALAGTTC